MKNILKKAAVLFVFAAVLCLLPVEASAASFYVKRQNIILTAGQTMDIAVEGNPGINIAVKSECASVAKGTYDAQTGLLTIKANDFGEAVLTLTNTDDTSDFQYLYVKINAPSASGTFKTFERFPNYKYFELDGGTKATGWKNINGKTCYFYPNGVMETYTGPVMSKNKLYFLNDGVYSGEIYDAYIFEVFNNNMPIADNALDFYKDSVSRYGKENVKVSRSSGNNEVVITVPSYMPGFPWGAKGQYYFSDGTGVVPEGAIRLSKYEFSGKVFMITGGYDDELYNETQKASYVKRALFNAFGKNCRVLYTESEEKIYRWTGVGAEKADVDMMEKNNSLIFEIYYP